MSQSITEEYRQIKKYQFCLQKKINQTNNPIKALSELPDEARWFIEKQLSNFHEYVEKGKSVIDNQ